MTFVYRSCDVELVPSMRSWAYRIKWTDGSTSWRDNAGKTAEDAKHEAEKEIDFHLE